MPSTIQTLPELLHLLWHDYTQLNPSALATYNLFVAANNNHPVENDHVAFRTFAHPKVGIAVMEKVFLKFGYRTIGEYQFEEKKLFAKHFEHADKSMPKIFISELKLKEMPLEVQNLASRLIEQLSASQLLDELLCTAGRLWQPITFREYNSVKEISEYAAWVAAFGFRVNHFTVSVNSLKTLPTLQSVNNFLKHKGIALNTSGGEIKGSPQELLEQSSTLAYNTLVEFKEGQFLIPACYYEFALRYPDQSGRLYQGFIAKSADKIFESTNSGQ